MAISMDIRADALRRVEQGETKSAVAKSIGLSTSTVWAWAKHLQSTNNDINPNLKKKYLERVKNGEIPTVVARELGVKNSTSRHWETQSADPAPPSDETLQKIKNALEEGLLPSQIAKDLQVSIKSVRAILRKSQGRVAKKNYYKNEIKQQAILMIASGSSYSEVATELGVVARNTIKSWYDAAVSSGSAKPYKRRSHTEDKSFEWISREYPLLDDWRESMAEWLSGEIRSIDAKKKALFAFIKQYLGALDLPSTRAVFLKRGTLLPDFYKTVCKQSGAGVSQNNYLHDFLDWVLLQHFSVPDDNDRPMVASTFCNPVPLISGSGLPSKKSSVWEVLPYGFICIFRNHLAAGPNFKDWTLAQSLLGGISLDGSNVGNDWFGVGVDPI